MRHFRVEGEFVLDESDWRVGKVFTDNVLAFREVTLQNDHLAGLGRIEFFDRRYVQVGDKVLTALERQEVGVIEGMPALPSKVAHAMMIEATPVVPE